MLVLMLAQLPFSYFFTVGKDQGLHSDLPFLQNFHKSESQGQPQSWRWSRSQFAIEVPGVGQRSTIVTMRVVSHRTQWDNAEEQAAHPTILTIQTENGMTIPLTLRLQQANYQIYMPASALRGGTLRLEMSTDPWQNPQDRREDLGVALGGTVHVVSTRSAAPVVPPLGIMLALPLSVALLWSALRGMGFSPNGALWLVLPLALATPLLLLTESPRLGFGSMWAMQTTLLTMATTLVCVWGIPPLLRYFNVAPPASLVPWLILLLVLTFVLKYGGRLYPESMPGDLQLHVNRSTQTLQGKVYIEAQHRGLPFPFPNGPYIALFPLMLFNLDLRFLLQIAMGVYEAITVLMLYVLLTRAIGNARMGILAAATYALTAGGFMNTWFCFHTQVAAQAWTALLLAVLVGLWPSSTFTTWRTWWVLVLLFIQVFLAHIGTFLNTSLVGLLIIALLWWSTRHDSEKRAVRWLASIGIAAAAFVALFYYGAFMDLIVEQTVGVATQGLNEVTERPPIPRETTLEVLWEGGFITHFGFFPVVLALPGILLLHQRRLRSTILLPLIWLTFLVSASQAVLPLITLNSITTRWLMFSSWGIAVTTALAVALLWRRGRSARVVVLAMGGYVCWITLCLYLAALAWRDPPIEPF